VDGLIPDAAHLFVIRLVTYGNVVVTTYHVDREPMFFEHEGKLVPSGKGWLVAVGQVCSLVSCSMMW